MRFFLYGYYGQGNLGDDLLLRACVLGILATCPDARFVVRAGRAGTGLDALRVPFEIAEVDEVLADQRRSKIGRLFSALAAFRRHLRRCDWFVFGGGTLFHERQSPLPLVLLLFICLMARAMRVRIAALGVGVAELRTPVARFALRAIIRMSDVFAVRDYASRHQCSQAGAGDKAIVTADLVFTLSDWLGPAPSGRTAGAATIAVSLSAAARDERASPVAIDVLARTIAEQVATGNRVILLSFQESAGGLSDNARLDAVIAAIPGEARDRVMRRRLVVGRDELIEVFSDVDLHVGMRYHGHVLAAIFGRPFVGVLHDNKIDEICKLFEMPAVELSGMTAAGLAKSIGEARRRGISSQTLATCTTNARRNFTLLYDAIGSGSD